MDAAAVLENYISDISSLPSEFTYILESLRDQDTKFYETRKRIAQRDAQIHKFIKANGSLSENPKEEQLGPKIMQDFDAAVALSNEKIDMANAGLYIISRHIKRLNQDIVKLEKDGYIPSIPGSVCNQGGNSAGLILDGQGGVTVGGDLDFTQEKVGVGRRGGGAAGAGGVGLRGSSGSARHEALSGHSGLNGSVGGGGGGSGSGRAAGSLERGSNHGSKGSKGASGGASAGGSHGLNGGVGVSGSGLGGALAASGGAASTHSPGGTTSRSGSSRPSKRHKTGDQFGAGVSGLSTPNFSDRDRDSDFGGVTPRQAGRGANEEEEVLYCVCQQVSFGNMVACDNPDCQYEWFHYDCVGLKEPPKGTWYCPTCVREKKEERRRRA